MSMQMTNERYSLLRHISAIGLSIYDTVLYLDIHDCPEARQYLEKRQEEFEAALEQYESKYGRLTHTGHPCEDVLWAWQLG